MIFHTYHFSVFPDARVLPFSTKKKHILRATNIALIAPAKPDQHGSRESTFLLGRPICRCYVGYILVSRRVYSHQINSAAYLSCLEWCFLWATLSPKLPLNSSPFPVSLECSDNSCVTSMDQVKQLTKNAQKSKDFFSPIGFLSTLQNRSFLPHPKKISSLNPQEMLPKHVANHGFWNFEDRWLFLNRESVWFPWYVRCFLEVQGAKTRGTK